MRAATPIERTAADACGLAADVDVMTTDHPRAQCIDLRATFAGQFRFVRDPAYAAESSERRRTEAPWLTRIPCRFGFIAPQGGRRLVAYATTRRRALAALPCVRIHAGGERDVLVTFDVADLPAVAELLEARRPPRLSPEERARRRARILAVAAARKTAAFSRQGCAIASGSGGSLRAPHQRLDFPNVSEDTVPAPQDDGDRPEPDAAA